MLTLLVALWRYILGEDPEEISNETLLKLLSFIVWGFVYILLTTRIPRPAEWCCRVVALLHGSLSTAVGLCQCGMRSMSFKQLQEPCQAQHYALMLMSWGYFAFDLLWCAAYWTESALMLCHHVSALLFITRFMHKKIGGCMFGCALGAFEVTNPLLQIRWFLREENMDKNVIYVGVEVSYLILFILVRGVVGTVVAYKALTIDEIDIEVKIMGAVLYCVSIGFIYDIYLFVRRRYPSRMAILRQTFAGTN